MPDDSIVRVLARIAQIQSLTGERRGPKEEFGRELDRAANEMNRREASIGQTMENPSINGAERASASRSAPPELLPLIAEASDRTGVPESLISAVIQAESGYRPEAVSPAGAAGLMQLMPGTARALGVDDPFDPRQNILGGAEYLRRQLQRFGNIEQALAAYNAGPGAVERFGGVPPYPETRSYVRRIMDALRRGTDRSE